MAKVQIINKSRKEFKCCKCGNIIPKGSKYYRGEINFGPTIIRCSDCGLQSWEVTTSDYQLSVGAIVYKWDENYSADQSGIEEIVSELETIKEDLEGRLENMPEALQDADTGMLLQNRIEGLENAIDDLNDIDEDSYKDEALDDFKCGYTGDDPAVDDADDYDELMEQLSSVDADDLESSLADVIHAAIDEALGNIDV